MPILNMIYWATWGGGWTPVDTPWIYRNSVSWVISFQTSAWVGISIADKNLWATTVYNSWDTYSFSNIGYGYERGNNYGWQYNVNPTNTSNTREDTTWYWPWNYYSSDVFILISQQEDSYYRWSSANNDDLRWGTTGTYQARRWPCAEWWHIPSGADAQTLVDAISSITWSVSWTTIKQYCKLTNRIPTINRFDWTWNDWDWGWIVYSDAYNTPSAWLLYLPDDWTHVVNENCRKSNAFPQRPFSNTFIQPTTTWTRLDS